MDNNDLDLIWSDEVVELPQRSRLISLPPIGIGTAYAEGLTSYIVRLARAHSVNPKRLIRTSFAAVRPDITDVVECGNFFSWGSRSINGLGQYANLFCEATTALTQAKDLRFLTLLPLQHLLPENGRGLCVQHPQWCPNCIAMMGAWAKEVFRPLTWSFRLYRYCSIHERPLVDRCPACGKFQHFIPKYPSLDHCSHCQAWLGKEGKFEPGFPVSERWACHAIEDVVSNLPRLEVTATRERFLRSLSTAMEACTDGVRYRFCREIGLEVSAVRSWFLRRRPSFPQWLSVSYGVRLWPSQLFAEVETNVAKGQRLRRRPATLTLYSQRPQLSRKEQRELKRKLARIAADPDDVTSLSAVARRIQLDMGSLKYWAPRHCAKIRDKCAAARRVRGEQRRAADVRILEETVRELIEQGQFPSAGRVNEALRKHGRSLIQPELRKAYRDTISRCCE